MRPHARALESIALALTVFVGSGPGPVAADCGDAPGRPDRVADVRGTTWVGTFLADATLADGSVIHAWKVKQVLAGDVPAFLIYRTTGPGCYGVGFRPGIRYLVSSGDLLAGSVFSTVAYQVKQNGRLRLVRHGGLGGQDYPRRLRLRTIPSAETVLAPGETIHLPEPGTSSLHIDDRLIVAARLLLRLALLSGGSGR